MPPINTIPSISRPYATKGHDSPIVLCFGNPLTQNPAAHCFLAPLTIPEARELIQDLEVLLREHSQHTEPSGIPAATSLITGLDSVPSSVKSRLASIEKRLNMIDCHGGRLDQIDDALDDALNDIHLRNNPRDLEVK